MQKIILQERVNTRDSTNNNNNNENGDEIRPDASLLDRNFTAGGGNCLVSKAKARRRLTVGNKVDMCLKHIISDISTVKSVSMKNLKNKTIAKKKSEKRKCETVSNVEAKKKKFNEADDVVKIEVSKRLCDVATKPGQFKDGASPTSETDTDVINKLKRLNILKLKARDNRYSSGFTLDLLSTKANPSSVITDATATINNTKFNEADDVVVKTEVSKRLCDVATKPGQFKDGASPTSETDTDVINKLNRLNILKLKARDNRYSSGFTLDFLSTKANPSSVIIDATDTISNTTQIVPGSPKHGATHASEIDTNTINEFKMTARGRPHYFSTSMASLRQPKLSDGIKSAEISMVRPLFVDSSTRMAVSEIDREPTPLLEDRYSKTDDKYYTKPINRDKYNPPLVPRSGDFYEHCTRSNNDCPYACCRSKTTKPVRKAGSPDMWTHDLYDSDEQASKPTKKTERKYGYKKEYSSTTRPKNVRIGIGEKMKKYITDYLKSTTLVDNTKRLRKTESTNRRTRVLYDSDEQSPKTVGKVRSEYEDYSPEIRKKKKRKNKSTNSKSLHKAESPDKWTHDLYDLNQHAPKTVEEIVRKYRYNIKKKECSPKIRKKMNWKSNGKALHKANIRNILYDDADDEPISKYAEKIKKQYGYNVKNYDSTLKIRIKRSSSCYF